MWKLQRIFGTILIISLVIFSNPSAVLFADDEASTPVDTSAASTPALTTDTLTPPAGNAGENTPPGDNGSNATNATTPSDTPSGDIVVETGTAVSGSDTTNVANTNETDTNTNSNPADTGSGSGGAAASDSSSGGAASTDTTVHNDNDAAVTINAASDADTGNNVASTTASSTGNAVVNTGNAYSYANVVNVVNTNIFNSQGFFLFLNSFFGGGTLDLSSLSFMNPSGPSGTTYCSLGGCDSNDASYVMINNNNATIDNAVVVRADSGGNTANAGNGNASVTTGNAYAAANVVNVANSNIVDSNYLLLSFNNFGDMNGDIVLPNADFFSHLFGNSLGSSANQNIQNNNTAAINNNVGATAGSGNNTASAANGSASVQTGNASADGGVTNVVNTNQVGGTTVFLLFRVFGDWVGNVFGAPDNIEWAETANGITLFSSDPTTNGNSPLEDLAVTNNSTATINNNVHVYALTGDNKASSSGGNASIQTGNAYAAANVMNIANTNIVGRNWIFAIFNIFGNWHGNISFGRPDLWIGAVAKPQTSGELVAGTDIEYHFTVTNRGDSTATNVHVTADYNPNHIGFTDGKDWTIGTLAPKQTVEIVKHGILKDFPIGETPIPVLATATLHESDANPTDNHEEVTVVGQHNVTGGSAGSAQVSNIPGGAGRIDPVWKIEKTVSTPRAAASSTVDYKIVVNNDGGTAFNAVLFDTVTDENDNIIFEQSWDLGIVPHGEEDTVTYSVFFHPGIPSGKYTNHAFIKAQSRSPEPGKGVKADSDVATATVYIEGDPLAEIPQNERSCGQYLFGSIKKGGKNDPSEVTKLQHFLSVFADFTNVKETGVYDQTTEDAVRLFQQSNGGEILSPWGLNGPTGYVYITTRKKINELYCKGIQQFPLTDADTKEISTYRSYITSLRSQSQVQKKIKVTAPVNTGAASTAPVINSDPEDVPASDTNNVIQSTTTILNDTIESVKDSATDTSAAVVNAGKALGDMVTTTANALTGLKGWFGDVKGSVHHFVSSFKFHF